MSNKPCPFCGNTLSEEFAIRLETELVYISRRKSLKTNYYSFCCSCGAQGSHGYTKKEAIDNWNRRK